MPRSRLLLLTILGTLSLLVIGDGVSTYLCLTTQSASYEVWEANPITNWVFSIIGIGPGLLLDTVIEIGVLIWLYFLAIRKPRWYTPVIAGTTFVALMTAYATWNNWSIYYALIES